MTMPAIISKTIDQAIKMLDSAGCKYKIIALDGTQYGMLEVVEPKKSGKKFVYPPGTMHKHYRPYVKDLKVGEVGAIPSGEFDLRSLQSAISGWASSNWGNRSYKTCISNNEVQILRIS
jgi:hypothetical protein